MYKETKLDKKFQRYKLRFLISLPDHTHILMNETMDKGVDFGIRTTEAREILKALQSKKTTIDDVYRFIHIYGQKIF